MPTSDPAQTSVWSRPAREGRSPLTREQIVAAAIGLLDDEGIDGLSMRRLAARLGSGATTIYWHVANRNELIELVVNEVYGEVELPEGDAVPDWRTETWRIAHEVRAAIVRHPWTVSVLDHLIGVFLGPNVVRLTEHMLVVMERAGFPLREAERALTAVWSYVLGVSMGEAAWHSAVRERGGDEQALADEMIRVSEQAAEDTPRLQELVAQYEHTDAQTALGDDFDYGLERVLDGLELRLDSIDR